MTESKITPPRELVRQWIKKCDQPDDPRWQEYEQDIANHAAQWGYEQRGEVNEAQLQQARDHRLEACCKWLRHEYGYGEELALKLRAAFRPKPPSLKESALNALEHILRHSQTDHGANTIRRALEALPE